MQAGKDLPCLHSDLTLLSKVSIWIWMRLYSRSACVDLRRYTTSTMTNRKTRKNVPAAIPAIASGGNE